MSDEQKITKVSVSGPNNSTLFTACCGLAVIPSEWKCPRCGALIEGRYWGKKS